MLSKTITQALPIQPARRQALRLLILTLVASALLPIGLLTYTAWSLDRTLHRAAEARIAVSLDVLMQHTLKVFQTAELALQTIRLLTAGLSDDEVRAREPEFHRVFVDLVHILPGVQSVWLIDRAGLPLVSDIGSPPPAVDASDREYFRALSATDPGTFIGQVVTPKVQGPPFFFVGRRRPSADGSFTGILDVSLLPTDFEAFYRQLDPDRAELYEMIRADGAVLARFPMATRPATVLRTETSPTLRAIRTRPEDIGLRVVSPIDGVERIVGYRPVPGYPLYLIAGVPTARISAQFWAAMRGYLIIGVPATLLALATVTLAIQRTRRLYDEEERRQAAEAALARTQRMEAIGQLTGGVAHDFNNLLTIIRGSNERLRRGASEARDLRAIDIIESAVQRGAALTRQLLTFASRSALAVETVDLAVHIPRVEEMLRHTLRGDIHTEAQVPATPCIVRVDPGELELALLNIGVNARDAMPNGGSLSLQVLPARLDGDPDTDGLAGEFIAVSVTDTGAGIPQAALAKVFEPFFTTKEVGQGTGLGLSQVYGFARQSGGTVTITSTLGVGTTVTIYLPRQADA